MEYLIHFVMRVMVIWSWPNYIFPLTVWYFSPTLKPMDRRSIFEPYWSILVLIKEWVNGVSIDRYRLQTVVWPMACQCVRRSTLRQIFRIEILGRLWPNRRMCNADGGSGYGPSMATVFCTCIFSEKSCFRSILDIGCYIISPLGTFVLKWILN